MYKIIKVKRWQIPNIQYINANKIKTDIKIFARSGVCDLNNYRP